VEHIPNFLSKSIRHELYSNRFLIPDSSSSGWPSDSLPATFVTGHAPPSQEPGSAAGSAATSNTAPTKNQGEKATTGDHEHQVHVGTKEMETVLVGLVSRLYKMAEGHHPFADRFEKAVR
jgi:hypothetical protein